MRRNELTIEVAGRDHDIPLGSFLSVAQNALHMLRDLQNAISKKRTGINWRITNVTFSSPLRMTILGEADSPETVGAVLDAYVTGLNVVEQEATLPEYFTEATMERAKAITKVLQDGVAKVAFYHAEARAVPTQRVAANIDTLLRSRQDEAGFEGRLEMISIHGDPKLRVYDSLTGEPVTVFFADEMFEKAKSAFGRRVYVFGTAKYDREGRPKSVKVKELTPLRERDELPQFGEIPPIDITLGEDASEFVRRGRHE